MPLIHGRLAQAQPKPFGVNVVTAANSFASVRCFVASVHVVAGHFHQLGVVFADLVQCRRQLCRHVAANLSVGSFLAAFHVQHLLRFGSLRQLVVDHFDLLNDFWDIDVGFANNAHVALDSLNLHSQHLRFGLSDHGVDRRGLGCVATDRASFTEKLEILPLGTRNTGSASC